MTNSYSIMNSFDLIKLFQNVLNSSMFFLSIIDSLYLGRAFANGSYHECVFVYGESRVDF